MLKRISRRHEAHGRANRVCTEHSALLDTTAGGQQLRLSLEGSVGKVDRLLALQEESIMERRAATAQVRIGRRAIRHAVKAVVTVGRLVTLADGTLMSAMRLPGPISDEDLMAYGRGMLERVAPHEGVFVAAGLPPDLLEKLAAAIDRLASARSAQSTARQNFTAATESIRDIQHNARRTIDAIEAVALNMEKTPSSSDMLTMLRVARRVGPRAGTSAADGPADSLDSPDSVPRDAVNG
jgi:hypothetical protein